MALKVKYIIFVIILLALGLPAIQAALNIFPEKPLHGDFEKKDMPALAAQGWFSGDYQAKLDPWLEQHIGFHNGLVRMHNQMDYSIYHKPNAEGVIRGKNGQLYESDYIRAWTGKDFVGEELLDRKLRQFRFLQQYLKEEFNTDLVLVLEPGKASIYPEDIPERYTKAEEGKTNYEYMAGRAQELGINLIDLNAYFLKIKDSTSYPLFPLQGTHWSEFAMWYAADSLLSYIEATRGIQLPEVIKEGTEYSMKLRSTDYDVGVTLNLLFELQHGEMPYPKYHFREDSTHQKPNVLAIADSYYWNFFNTRIPKNLFNNEAFWYFYKKVYPDTYYGDKNVEDLDLAAEVEKQDIIFFMTTERFMYMIDRGFVDDLISIYGVQYSRNELTRYKTSIINLGTWFVKVLDKAEQKGVSPGEMLERDARYLLWQTDPEQYYSIFGPGAIIQNIRDTEDWFNNIKKSAEEKNISVDERLMNEAMYIMENEHPEALAKYNRIEQIMANIRADSSWHAHILEKATHYYMTEEEMVRADAEYVFWLESKKH